MFEILLGLSAAGQGIGGMGQAIADSNAIQAQGEYQARMSELNARFANYLGDDAILRGERAVQDLNIKTRQLVGNQRTSAAAQGIDVDSGSARDIQEQTKALGELDAITIRNNAWREAFGYRKEAIESRGQGIMSSIAARQKARSTILTGGMNALSSGLRSGAYFYKGLK